MHYRQSVCLLRRVLYDAAVSPSVIFGALAMAAAGNWLHARTIAHQWGAAEEAEYTFYPGECPPALPHALCVK